MIWLLTRHQSDEAQATARQLIDFAEAKGVETSLLKSFDQPEYGDLIVVLGGDGTLIHAAQHYGHLNLPILAINLGRLGYITGFRAEQATQALEAALTGELVEDMRLRLAIGWAEHQAVALNEALITSGEPGRICSLALAIDEQPATTLRGDGTLVATPTGSTAYALSAGGPVPLPGLQALVVVPVAPHSIRFRPLVLPPSHRITITPEEDAWLVLDGQERQRLPAGTQVTLDGSAPPLRLLKEPDHEHLQTLRSKLHWGEWS